jgi:2-hydroxy-6-oxonona-2,4-dienedioate hydrolase
VSAARATSNAAHGAETQSLSSEVGGLRMHGFALGAGPAVVLIHGYGVSGAYMLPLAQRLADSCSVFVPDLPGQGRSEPLPDGPTIDGLAEALGAWVEVLGLVRPAFVANSMGCQIATELAVRHPRRVGPLVLIGPTVDPARRGARRQLFGALQDAGREPLSLLARAVRDDAAVGLPTLLATARAVLADRPEDRLPLIEQRTLVVHGGDDGFVSHAWAERVATLLPRGRLLVVPGEPHAVHYTRPDLIARAALELLAEEGERRRRDLVRSLQHRHVTAGDAHDPRIGQPPLPLLGDAQRHESVALAPDE